MKMCSSGFAPRRRQGGFIQGAILFALVIIAVVVAAFSLANRDSQNNADTEQARVNSAYVLKVGSDIQNGINRATADGFPPAELGTNLVLLTEAAEGQLSLFDPNLRYTVRPQFPTTALVDAQAQPFGDPVTGVDTTAEFVVDAIDGVGGAPDDVVLEIPNLREDVCKRINVSTNNVLVTAAPPTAVQGREGCYSVNGTSGFTYYRVVATDVG
jgi:hypothetical protein